MGDDPATLPSRVPLGLYPLSTTCAGPGPVDMWKIKMGYNVFYRNLFVSTYKEWEAYGGLAIVLWDLINQYGFGPTKPWER